MTLEVVPASADDAVALADLRIEMDAEDGVVGSPAFRSTFVEWFGSVPHGWTALIAKEDGDLLGTLWLRFIARVPRPSEPVAAPLGHLTNFFVRPAHRNRGVGSVLLERARSIADEAGAELLVVWPSERSVPLYERHGFATPTDLLELRLR